MSILHIDSSISGDASVSRELSQAIVEALTRDGSSGGVTYRDLAAEPLDHLTLPAFGEKDSLEALEKFKATGTVVIGAPMYNFTISSQLKAWIDRVLVAGETFRYRDDGSVEGLMGGKRVIVAIARGGLYGEDSAQRSVEHAERYLTSVLGFIGIEDPVFVIAEGLKVSEEIKAEAIAAAHARIADL